MEHTSHLQISKRNNRPPQVGSLVNFTKYLL